MMVGQPDLKVAHHGGFRLLIERQVIRTDAEYLGSALSTSISERQVDIRERLVDLRVDFFVDFSGLRVPTTCGRESPVLDGFSLPIVVIEHEEGPVGTNQGIRIFSVP